MSVTVRLEGVGREYRMAAGNIRAVAGVDLRIDAGSSVAIVGPSGSGKSTLLALIGGLEPVTAGSIFIGEVDIARLSEAGRAAVRRERMGFVFQSYDLLPFLTAWENVEFQLALSGASSGAAQRAEALFTSLGLADHALKLPDQLSGGQRQRVGIARALAHSPALVLADEPTGELDTVASREAVDLLLRAQVEAGATLVVVTHDPAVAARFQRVVGLRDGRVVSDSRPTPDRDV